MSATVQARRRSRMSWLGIGIGIVALGAVLAVIASLARMPTQGLLDPEAAGPDGSRALTQILQQQGVRVTVARDRDAREAAVGNGDGVTLVVGTTGALADEEVEGLVDAADDVVFVDPWTRDLRVLFGGELTGTGTGPQAPACDLSDARRAGEVTVGRVFDAPEADSVCYPDGIGSALAVSENAHGRVAAIDGRTLFTNATLASDGNAALGVNLLGRQPHLVWYLPAIGDSTVDLPPPTLAELTPPWVTPAIVLLMLAGVAAAIWRGRRFGPLVAENLPVSVRAAETTAGRARLYARSGDPTHAADQLRIGTLRRLARLLGLGPAAAAPEISDAAAARLSADARMLHGILIADPVSTDSDLVDLADRLRSLENAVARAVRPERKHP